MLFLSVYYDRNYPLEVVPRNFLNLAKTEYFILFSIHNHFIVVYSLFCIQLVCLQFVNVIDVYSYYSKLFNAPYVLLSILIYFLNINFKCFLFYIS